MHAPVDVVSAMLQMALFCWAFLAKENVFFFIIDYITMQYSHYSATTITGARHLDKVDQSDYRKNQ